MFWWTYKHRHVQNGSNIPKDMILKAEAEEMPEAGAEEEKEAK
jgi:hypothetical protein